MSEYVRNIWHMAAWIDEVLDEEWLTRTLLDRKWLIYRLADGSYAMLQDRCPHRFVPLSMGRREGDVVHCRYHGLGFGPDGACVHNPFPADPPRHVRAHAFPIIARHAALWFWPGDPERADPALIPDFAFIDPSGMNRSRMVIVVAP